MSNNGPQNNGPDLEALLRKGWDTVRQYEFTQENMMRAAPYAAGAAGLALVFRAPLKTAALAATISAIAGPDVLGAARKLAVEEIERQRNKRK